MSERTGGERRLSDNNVDSKKSHCMYLPSIPIFLSGVRYSIPFLQSFFFFWGGGAVGRVSGSGWSLMTRVYAMKIPSKYQRETGTLNNGKNLSDNGSDWLLVNDRYKIPV